MPVPISRRPSGVKATQLLLPGEPTSGYVALFAFYAIMVGLALLIYLLAHDAKPEISKH